MLTVDSTKKASGEIVAMMAKQLKKDLGAITPDKRIKEDLNADSLDIVELIMSIEDKYGISVPDEAALEIKTVGDLVAYVEKTAKA